MSAASLKKLFASLNIDSKSPGFYDSPEFRAVEQHRPEFLECYAEWVNELPHSEDYLSRVRKVAPELAYLLFNEVSRAGVDGACVDVSGALVRMLEREQIWATAVGGGLTITFPQRSGLGPSYFGVIAKAKITAAHMWVHAPPFRVIDVTLPVQAWQADRQAFITRPVIVEKSKPATATIYDLIDLDVIGKFREIYGKDPTLADARRMIPHTFPFMSRFPAFQVSSEELKIRYVPTKIGATEENLDELQGPRLNGKLPGALYDGYKNSRDQR